MDARRHARSPSPLAARLLLGFKTMVRPSEAQRHEAYVSALGSIRVQRLASSSASVDSSLAAADVDSLGDTSQRVLFVDDDPLACRAFRHVIRGTNFSADFATSGEEALEKVRAREYAVVVTDLVMPGIDGIGLIDAVTRIHPACAFLLVTGEPNLQLCRTSMADAAVVSITSKPWQNDDILATLSRAFDLHAKRLAMLRTQWSAPPLSVLVVEDDIDCGNLINVFLREDAQVEVRVVHRLQDAVAMLHERRFEAIVTDLMLPDARGADSVVRLRRSAPNAAIVVCSGADDEALALQMIQAGAHDYLSKNALSAKSLHRALRFARQRKYAEQQLLRLARCDQLTGLANRAYFNEQLEQTLTLSERHGTRFSVLYLDLDGFKAVNDELGHDAGDSLLREIASRVQGVMRPYDRVARLGGDEFAVLLPDTGEIASVRALAERIIRTVGQPVRIGDQQVSVTASVGAALYPTTATSGAELLRRADQAMYRAKRDGRNCLRIAEASQIPPR